jgi:hypothetical protein
MANFYFTCSARLCKAITFIDFEFEFESGLLLNVGSLADPTIKIDSANKFYGVLYIQSIRKSE